MNVRRGIGRASSYQHRAPKEPSTREQVITQQSLCATNSGHRPDRILLGWVLTTYPDAPAKNRPLIDWVGEITKYDHPLTAENFWRNYRLESQGEVDAETIFLPEHGPGPHPTLRIQRTDPSYTTPPSRPLCCPCPVLNPHPRSNFRRVSIRQEEVECVPLVAVSPSSSS